MFDNIARQLVDPCASVPPDAGQAAGGSGGATLELIQTRLERELPPGPYLPDDHLAKLLHISMKTLCNRRGTDPARYPRPLKLGGSRKGVHARDDLIHWLAREELAARTRTIHRCN